ncbi:polysaccharide pyruvyl transferase family protein [Azohydromonas australica]|uniref:polysaccharide pyruvyl transferase family protein n=1 Tax=Azohydromonas australica TaxID=364039 RepID=UPI00041938D0|nr:polysaccharide pyruvyl transferase family protein [Azohydromonas australica]
MNKILLLGASFGTGNMGVGALTAGALTVIRRRFPQASVSLLDYGREAALSQTRIDGKTLSVPLVNLRFSWKLFLLNNVALLLALSVLMRCLSAQGRRWLVQRNPWLRAVTDADAAVAVSGGDSFSDIYGLGRFFYVALPQLLAVSLGVKLIMLPQTIGPFRTGLARRVAAFLMRRAELVYSRDAVGIDEIGKLVDPAAASKARFCYDIGFVLEPHAPCALEVDVLRQLPRQRPVVGLNVSGLLYIGGYTRRNMFELKLDYNELVECLVAYFTEVEEADVVLIPHVFGAHQESDVTAAQALYERLRQRHGQRLHVMQGDFDQNEVKYAIGCCDFFVGARMHACIAALSQAVPAVGVAYSDKFAGVFDSVGVPELVVDPRRMSLDEALAAVRQAFTRRNDIHAELGTSMPRIKARVLALLDDIA